MGTPTGPAATVAAVPHSPLVGAVLRVHGTNIVVIARLATTYASRTSSLPVATRVRLAVRVQSVIGRSHLHVRRPCFIIDNASKLSFSRTSDR